MGGIWCGWQAEVWDGIKKVVYIDVARLIDKRVEIWWGLMQGM